MSLFSKSKNKVLQPKAFTLIELLIVVAILTILAIGVLAAIDPIEQFNRSQDSTLNNLAAEYKGALDRFYTARGSYPTSITAGITASLTSTAGQNSISEMVVAGELKSSFTLPSIGNLSSIYVNYSPAGGQGAIVCNLLKSKSFKSNNNAQFSVSGVSLAGCPNKTNPGAATPACAICLF